jgi:hypothetical protein
MDGHHLPPVAFVGLFKGLSSASLPNVSWHIVPCLWHSVGEKISPGLHPGNLDPNIQRIRSPRRSLINISQTTKYVT